jgi:hypothetical protein
VPLDPAHSAKAGWGTFRSNFEFPSLLSENGDVLNLLVDQKIDLILSKMFENNSFYGRKENHGILFKDHREVQSLLGCLTFGC